MSISNTCKRNLKSYFTIYSVYLYCNCKILCYNINITGKIVFYSKGGCEMILYDISTDLLSAKVYPGDPEPKSEQIFSMENDDMYNLSKIDICTHIGTHIDAPLHFCQYGNSIDKMRLSTFYGKCTVISFNGIITGEDMERLLPYCRKRIIFHGKSKAFLSSSAAFVLAQSDVMLVGTDALSIAPDFEEAKTHSELAKANIAVLEGLDLSGIKDGDYTLCAFPIKLAGLEAAPCRAILMEQEKGF